MRRLYNAQHRTGRICWPGGVGLRTGNILNPQHPLMVGEGEEFLKEIRGLGSTTAMEALKAKTTPEQLAAAYKAVNISDDD
jgi:hypothetical protein